jgi:CRISPR-associated protein Csd2
VENGNPNGDPDADNMPRVDPDTDHGIVTDVCVKRKIRNYIDIVKGGEPGYNIYVKQGTALNTQDAKGINAIKSKDKSEKSDGFRDFMCSNFFDIRTFGAVMTTAAKDKELSNAAGQVRGPVQLAFGRSIDRITPQDIAITRVTVTTEEKGKIASTEIGRKHIVPYGLYRQEGFISANLAKTVTGFSEDDLNLFWNAVIHMFDEDRSAARGKMALRELIVFKHSNELGDAPAHKLFELVTVKRREGVLAPRAYGDYIISVDGENLPEGVTVAHKV